MIREAKYRLLICIGLIVFCFLNHYSLAQIKTNISFSDNHTTQLKELKNLKRVNKRALKDVIAQKKILVREMKRQSQQLDEHPELKRYVHHYEQNRQRVVDSKSTYDSLKILKKKVDIHPDSLNKTLAENLVISKQLNQWENLKNISSEYSDSYDSLDGHLFENVELPDELKPYNAQAENYLEQTKSYQQELQKLKKMQDSLSVAQILIKTKQLDKIEGYFAKQALEEDSKKLIGAQGGLESLRPNADLPFDPNDLNNVNELAGESMEKVQDTGLEYFKDHADKLETAHSSMAKLKKKYSYVPNSNDLSTARKISSLDGVPLKKRLILGGTLQVHAGDPVKVDFNPLVGYQFDKRFSMGIGTTYRTSFGSGESFIPSGEKSVFGGRLFSEYVVFKSFYIHGELESLRAQVENDNSSDIPNRKWSNGILVGVGKSYSFSNKVKGNVTLLYNLTHDDKGPHRKPLVVRFGFALQ